MLAIRLHFSSEKAHKMSPIWSRHGPKWSPNACDPPPLCQNDLLKAPKWPQHAAQIDVKTLLFSKSAKGTLRSQKPKDLINFWRSQRQTSTPKRLQHRRTNEPRTVFSTELPRRCANLSISKRSSRFITCRHRFWCFLASLLVLFWSHVGPKSHQQSDSKCYLFKKCALHVWLIKISWFD